MTSITTKDLKTYIFEQVLHKNLSKEAGAQFVEALLSLERQGVYNESIAIVGMACRFPGASSLDAYWSLLAHRGDAVGNFPHHRREDVLRVKHALWEEYRDVKTRPGCFLESIDLFDHEFFGISPAEASVMAPSQRLFLEVAWQAIENGGYRRCDIDGTDTGVYVGHSTPMGYERICPIDDPNVEIGNTDAMIPARLSYLFNLKGPSSLIDTTCSSSLVALHAACSGIQNGDCEQAIVGGVNVILLPIWQELAAMGNEASDGRCKAFDAAADGISVGEGIGALLIKPLDQALKEGHSIYAIIQGSAINSDARSNGLTAPNPQAQVDVISQAWAKAEIDPLQISYIEAHGTGTKLGDPIEIQALSTAFRKYHAPTRQCPMGSVKSNIGHLDAAAGMASVIKVILSMERQQIPASLHFHQPNPYIDFEHAPVFVNTELRDWNNKDDIRIAGVSGFGISGTNAHVILKAPTYQAATHTTDSAIFVVSARSRSGLGELLRLWQEFLQIDRSYSLQDLCYTLNMCREHYAHRIAFVVSNMETLCALFKDLKQELFFSPEHYSCVENSSKESHQIRFGDVERLLSAYLAGDRIDFDFYYQGQAHERLFLPNTPLERVRHWPTLGVPEKVGEEHKDLNTYFFDLNWVEQKRKEATGALSGDWLIFAPSTHLGDQISARLEKGGGQVFRLLEGDRYCARSATVFTVNPHNFSDYDRVFDAIGIGRLNKLIGVIHAWDLYPEDDGMSSLANVTDTPFRGAYSLFYLIKMLCQHQLNQNLQITLLTAFAHQVLPDDPIFPTRATIVGLNKVVMQEQPKISTFQLDFDLVRMDDEEILDHLLKELLVPVKYRDDLVAFRNGKRYLQFMHQLDTGKKGDGEIVLRQDDLYLFAGGGGYLGIQTCISFAKKQKNLTFILFNRSSLPERAHWEKILATSPDDAKIVYQIKGILEVERLGSKMIWKQVDVTISDHLAAAVDEVRENLGPIRGVFVAMKHINVKSIEEMSMEEYEGAVLSKLRGVWLLDALTQDDPLRFFINFSSISSIMGGPVNSDCTSVNAFLDAFGAWRNRQGRHTVTLNLTEILTEDKKGTEHKVTMLPPITYTEFLACVDFVLKKNLSYSIIASFDYKIMQVVLSRIKIRFSKELLSKIEVFSEQSAHTARAYSEQEIETKLIEIWKEVLGHEELSMDADFFNSGGSSLSALKLLRLIEANFGTKFEVADLYTYCTIRQMHQRVCELKGLQEADPLMAVLDGFEKNKISLEEASSVLNR